MNVMSTIKIILISLMLSSCTGIRVKVATDCSWAEPIDPSAAIIDYLVADESPDDVVDFINDIADHDDLYERFCLN